MTFTDDLPGRSGRIELTVQRELARRRRLMWTYALLLLIPLGVGGLFLATGFTSQAVSPDSEASRQQIEEQRKQIAQQAAKVDELTRSQNDLKVRVKAVDSGLQNLEPRLVRPTPTMAAPSVDIAAVHRGLDVRLDSLDDRVQKIEDQQKKILAEFEEIRRSQAVPRGNKPGIDRLKIDELKARKLQPVEKPPR